MLRAAIVAAAVAALVAGASAAPAQGVVSAGPSGGVIRSSTSMTIPAVFDAAPGTVLLDSLDGSTCAPPGVCFDVPVTVRANSKWQLQVALNPNASALAVGWVESRSPLAVQPLAAGTYLTVARGTTATLFEEVVLMFSANNTTGDGRPAPTAAQLAASLSFRVTAAP